MIFKRERVWCVVLQKKCFRQLVFTWEITNNSEHHCLHKHRTFYSPRPFLPSPFQTPPICRIPPWEKHNWWNLCSYSSPLRPLISHEDFAGGKPISEVSSPPFAVTCSFLSLLPHLCWGKLIGPLARLIHSLVSLLTAGVMQINKQRKSNTWGRVGESVY